MRNWKKAATAFVVIAIVVSGLAVCGCGKSSDESSKSEGSQIVEVSRGTLLTTVSAIGSISMPHHAELTFGSGGTVSEVNVEFGDVVKEGEMLARLDAASLEKAVTQAEASLRTAQINLEKAKEPFSAADIAKAEATVESAGASLNKAEDELKDALNPYSEADVAEAEGAVRNARVALDGAQHELVITQKNSTVEIEETELKVRECRENYQSSLEKYYGLYYTDEYLDWSLAKLLGADLDDIKLEVVDSWTKLVSAKESLEIAQIRADESLAAAQNSVAKAEDTLLKAEENLEDIKAGADAVIVETKESQLATARAALAKAEEDLAEMKAGPDLQDVELKQIQVDKAQITLDEAKEQLEEAAIVAPFDGTVANVGVSVGDKVTASTSVVLLVDTGEVEIDAAVDEIDVAKVKAGQMVGATLDAIPNAMLRGKVIAVSPIAQMQAGVVTYKVSIEVQNARGVELREGMTTSVDIVVERKDNVLLVPSRAIRRNVPDRVVDVAIGEGGTEERPVEIGSSDAMRTEILSGLEEGEKIVVPSGALPSNSSRIIMPGMGGGGPR
jgi:HlyD family secretion protein